MSDKKIQPVPYSLKEIEQAAKELVDESRYLYSTDPNAFVSIQGKKDVTQQLIQVLEQVKQRDTFTGIILYGNSIEKLAIAQKAASYLGSAFYDLVTEEEEQHDQDDLDRESAEAFSRRFTQFLAEDIQKQNRAVVCWIDRKDDIYKRKSSWEEELEYQFEQTILQLKNVVAIQILESGELLSTDYFRLIDAEWKIRIDDKL
ncbi:hypothetical protein [Risungbinella massiliensis]|uniref:hypothetical protein n=1 Tax=Risungbinella massiliensis TaxID=1329796 RepID=UPI0005CC3663|nr:hypothetical protein [Risungbinella massiliensis]